MLFLKRKKSRPLARLNPKKPKITPVPGHTPRLNCWNIQLFLRLTKIQQLEKSNLRRNPCQRKKQAKSSTSLLPNQLLRRNLKHKLKRRNTKIEKRHQMSSPNKHLNLSLWILMLRTSTILLHSVNKLLRPLLIRNNHQSLSLWLKLLERDQKTCLSSSMTKKRENEKMHFFDKRKKFI